MAQLVGIPKPDSSADRPGPEVPPSVVEDAYQRAREMVGSRQRRVRQLVDQLLAAYKEARESSVLVVFNPGGWGWSPVEKADGWRSIVEGIRSKLTDLGHRTLVVTYQRTSKGLLGCLLEMRAVARDYPERARELAVRVDFLLKHIPQMKVIVAGESMGTVIADKTMSLLRHDKRVYSIQTGVPFWHESVESERTLLLKSNGEMTDTFSQGKILTIVWATVRSLFGWHDGSGTILNWLHAPGHDYSWQHPGVSGEVGRFLETNFGEETDSWQDGNCQTVV
jgi:hypothetical protein